MHIPEHIVRKLEEIDPTVRLGYGPPPRAQGKRDQDPEGRIALVLIAPARKAESILTGVPWNNRGPLYGRSHDPATEVPVALVFYRPETPWAEILQAAHTRVNPHCSIVHEMSLSARAAAKQADEDMNELAGEFGEELAWRAERPDAASPEPVPLKHLSKDEKDVLTGDHESQKPLTDIFDDCIPK